jgi:hypothetical protein
MNGACASLNIGLPAGLLGVITRNHSAAHAAVPDSHVIIGFKASMVVALQKFAAQSQNGPFFVWFLFGEVTRVL